MMKLEPATVFALALAFVIALLLVAFIQQRQQISGLEYQIERYKGALLWKSGATILNGKPVSYQLLSIDGGQTWYVVDGGKIIGTADEVYPGLVEQIEGMDDLVDYVRRHGPINLSSLTSEAARILIESGFKVREKE